MSADGPDGSTEPVPADNGDRPDLDVEAAFAAIVAGWSSAPAEPSDDDAAPGSEGTRAVPWPAAEDVPAPADPAAGTAAAPVPEAPATPSVSPIAWLKQQDDDVEAEIDRAVDGQGFVPPDPEPLPTGDLTTLLSWMGVIGGPLFLVFAALFWSDLPQWLLLASVVAFVGGFATLVARMPHERDADDDDGAVV